MDIAQDGGIPANASTATATVTPTDTQTVETTVAQALPPASEQDKSQAQSIPYDRFKEVNDKYKAAQLELEQLKGSQQPATQTQPQATPQQSQALTQDFYPQDNPLFRGLETPQFKEDYPTFNHFYADILQQLMKDLPSIDRNAGELSNQESTRYEQAVEAQRLEAKQTLQTDKAYDAFEKWMVDEVKEATEKGSDIMTIPQYLNLYQRYVAPKVSNAQNKTTASKVAVPRTPGSNVVDGKKSIEQMLREDMGMG